MLKLILSSSSIFEISFMMIVILVVFGIIIGALSTLGGIGGGVLIMPIFLTFLDIDFSVAKGTSLFMIMLSSGVGTITHYKNGKVNIKNILIFSFFSILGSLFSLLVISSFEIEQSFFNLLFGLFEIFIAIRMILKAKNEYGKAKKEKKKNGTNNAIKELPQSVYEIGERKTKRKELISSFFLFFCSGILASFLGIGGGVINTPTLYGLLNFPLHYATATSSGIIFVNMILNVIGYGIKGQIDWGLGLIMGIGMMIGSFLSAHHAPKVSRTVTLTIIGALLTIVGMNLVLNFFL